MHENEIPEPVVDWLAAGRPEPVPAVVRDWLAGQNDGHAELDAIAAIWNAAAAPLTPVGGLTDLRARMRQEPRLQKRITGIRAAAAIVLLAAGIGTGWFASNALRERYSPITHINVPAAASAELKLAGNITVKLNAQSTLSYREVDGEVESVRLEGEAYFHVPHDPERVFTVETASGVVRDIGTTFNVRARDNEVLVVVSDGTVSLEAEGDVVEVEAGMSARAARGTPPQAAARADVLAALAWTAGRLVFIDRELQDIAAELTRHFGKTIGVSPDLRMIRITATIAESAEADDAIRAIALAAGVHYQQTSTGWLFTSY